MRYAKYVDQAARNMIAHDERSFLCLKEHIDSSRSWQNYNLAPDRGCSNFEYYQARLKEVKCQKRDDVKTYCQWIVTLPKDYPLSMADGFFKASYDYLKEKYGEKNIISAHVHYDEVTPHMHFAFIPVVKGIKKSKRRGPTEIEKVCAKECVTQFDLDVMHPRMQEHLETVLGRPVNLLNEATRQGNIAIKELKRRTAVQRLEEASEVAKDIEDHAGKLLQGLQQAVAVAPVSADSFDQYWHDNWAGKWQHKQKLFGEDESRIEMDKADFIELFGDLEKYYTLAKDLAEKNKALQEALPQIVDEADLLKAGELRVAEACFNRQIRELGEQYNRAIKNEKVLSDKASDIAYRLSLSSLEYNKLDKKYKDLDKDYKRLQEEHEELQKECDGVKDITNTFYEMFRRYPDTMQEVLQNYADATKKDIEFGDENGVIGKAKSRVRDLGPEVEIN